MSKSKYLVRKVAVVSVILLAIGLLAGCNSNTTKNSTSKREKHISINLATAGDSNMLEFFKNKINPEFYKKYPNITVNVVGTGAGDSGSRNVYSKLKAQKDAGVEEWDIDLAVVHQSIMSDIMKDGLAAKYVDDSANKKYVVGNATKNSLGTDVEGYVIPMFNSQTVLAYNPQMVKDVPKTFDELVEWIKANPKKFGYNGVKGGMSGVAFTTSYVFWKTGKYEELAKGPYDEAVSDAWPTIMKNLKELPVTYTQGNAGTLDLLNRGEIAMGPVWVDMFLLWKSEGRMDPNMGLVLPEPGMPGQPMYLMIPEKSTYPEEALKYIDFITSPKIQADIIVAANNWHPGIDAEVVFKECSEEAKNSLFKDVTAEDISKNGLSFPLAPYLKDVIRVYEETR